MTSAPGGVRVLNIPAAGNHRQCLLRTSEVRRYIIQAVAKLLQSEELKMTQEYLEMPDKDGYFGEYGG